MNASIEKYLNRFLTDNLNLPVSTLTLHSVGGGSINDSYRVQATKDSSFFLKVNSSTKYPKLFQKEKTGLEILTEQKKLRVPSVIACDEIDNYQVLLLEWIQGGLKTENFWKQFGKQLASLHHVTAPSFGFEEDNYMGALPQVNDRHDSWVSFFVHYRLQPQVERASKNHFLEPGHLKAFEDLYKHLGSMFDDEQPSLLHGDLWSGNFMCGVNSEPVLIDPAVYFGHRSMDLAMTTLFGGFERPFYESYNYHFPFPRNYRQQWDVCNLYPLLIHLNLFGTGYLGQIDNILKSFT